MLARTHLFVLLQPFGQKRKHIPAGRHPTATQKKPSKIHFLVHLYPGKIISVLTVCSFFVLCMCVCVRMIFKMFVTAFSSLVQLLRATKVHVESVESCSLRWNRFFSSILSLYQTYLCVCIIEHEQNIESDEQHPQPHK